MNYISFVLSLFFRALLVVIGVIGAIVSWKGLSVILWQSDELASAVSAAGGDGAAFQQSYGILYAGALAVSSGLALGGLFLVFRRLQLGVGAMEFKPPHTPGRQLAEIVIFGLFGLLFAYKSVGYVLAIGQNVSMGAFGTEGQAVVVEKWHNFKSGAKDRGHFLKYNLETDNGQFVQSQMNVDRKSYSEIEIGDKIPVIYWPGDPEDSAPKVNFDLSGSWLLFLQVLIYISLAIIGLTRAKACISIKLQGDGSPIAG